jgi:hypothetical protein
MVGLNSDIEVGGGGGSLLEERLLYLGENLLRTKRKATFRGDADMACGYNCSGNGICLNGSCYCQIKYEGSECHTINFSYHIAFSSIFFVLALTSLIQLVMCIHAEYLRMKKNPSIVRACRVTTQKLLYFLVFLACVLRGAYFAAPTLSSEWSISLMAAYYPVVLTGASLIVCFWAEVFHLREIRWDRPRFLSKSLLGFLAFNVITYTLLVTELFLVWIEHEHREFYTHIFNGCYAVLMFVVVVFFLIYGVEVFFNVRGGFTIPRVNGVISSTRTPIMRNKRQQSLLVTEEEEGDERTRRASLAIESTNGTPKRQQQRRMVDDEEIELAGRLLVGEELHCLSTCDSVVQEEMPRRDKAREDEDDISSAPKSAPASPTRLPHALAPRRQSINTSQLHQSRVGLLSQAVMMMITVGFILSETLEQFWKTKVDLSSRNTHDIIFRTVEIGVALWFPCVLWNCIRPEQLWCLNPKKILERMPPLGSKLKRSKSVVGAAADVKEDGGRNEGNGSDNTETDESDRGPECWICYDPDALDSGPMINPCDCKGDVGAVHHDCLRRWLVETADNPDALNCKVCNASYMVEKGSQFSLAQGFTAKQWITTASIVSFVCLTMGGCWAVIQIYSQPWIRMLAVGSELLIVYISLRALGLNTLSAYQRAKVSALKIVNLKRRGNAGSPVATVSPTNSVSIGGLESLRRLERDDRL